MEINSTGAKKSELKDYLSFWTDKLREKYGNDFVIKKEGVVDNLATTSSMVNMLLEDVVMYLIQQMNPYTCSGEFQDALYSLIGLERKYSSYTVVQRTISGVAGTVCEAGSILFKNKSTDDQFRLNSAVTIGEDGTAKGSFTAIELGSINLEPEETLAIVDAPDEIRAVYYTNGDSIVVGDDYEDDSEFRLRWQQNQNLSNGATSGSVEKFLLPYVTSDKNLKIIDNKTDEIVDNTPPHTLQIIIYTPESDETIAKTIFEHLLDGLELYGTTVVPITDSAGTVENISFTRATTVDIFFKVEVALQSGYQLPQVISNIQNAIVNNFDLSMGEKVVANDYIAFLKDIEGIDYINDIKINKDNGDSWYNVSLLDIDEIAQIKLANINIFEVE